MFNIKMRVLAASFGALTVFSGTVQAQNYPTKPVKLVIPYTPGGVVDIAARIIADGLQQQLKQPFLVDNRPGAFGVIAARAVTDAEPDGYTLLVATLTEFGAIPAIRDVPYQVDRDFNPIGKFASSELVLSVGKNIPVKSLAEFVTRAKASNLPIQYGTPGAGTNNHIVGEWLADAIGVKFQHIPYKGGAPTINALMAGDIEFALLQTTLTKPQSDAGKVKILAIASSQRSESLPDVPTFKESNVPITFNGWIGLFSPKKTPHAVNTKLFDALNAVLEAPETKARLLAQGLDIAKSLTPKAFQEGIAVDAVQIKTIVKRANIAVE